jgi:hypothetical protein
MKKCWYSSSQFVDRYCMAFSQPAGHNFPGISDHAWPDQHFSVGCCVMLARKRQFFSASLSIGSFMIPVQYT